MDRASGDAGRGGERDRSERSGSAGEGGAEVARDLVRRRLGPLPGNSELVREDRVPGGVSQAARVGSGPTVLRWRTSLLQGRLRSRTRVEVAPEFVDSPLLPRVLLFGWFLRLYKEGSGIEPFRRVEA